MLRVQQWLTLLVFLETGLSKGLTLAPEGRLMQLPPPTHTHIHHTLGGCPPQKKQYSYLFRSTCIAAFVYARNHYTEKTGRFALDLGVPQVGIFQQWVHTCVIMHVNNPVYIGVARYTRTSNYFQISALRDVHKCCARDSKYGTLVVADIAFFMFFFYIALR